MTIGSDDVERDNSAGPRPGAFFGRRKGHKLRERQAGLMETRLPELRVPPGVIDDPARLFAAPVRDVWLEIGFGGGEHLLSQLRGNPDVGLIGCEPFVNGVAKVVAATGDAEAGRLALHDADAAELLPRLPAASIGRAFLLYPDPWPKRRQRKRRFVSDATVAALARVLRPGAIFRFASDIDDYVAWTLAHLARSPDFEWVAERASDWLEPWSDWPGTRYEAKALREGRRPSYLTFRRR